jgi:hypothetical protein
MAGPSNLGTLRVGGQRRQGAAAGSMRAVATDSDCPSEDSWM